MTNNIADPNHPMALTSDDDRAWFDEHPKRSIRLRYPTDGDGDPSMPAPKFWASDSAVIVFSPTNGVRFRFSVSVEPGSVAAACLAGTLDDDRYLGPTVWDLLEAARGRLGDKVVDRLEFGLALCIGSRHRLNDWKFP